MFETHTVYLDIAVKQGPHISRIIFSQNFRKVLVPVSKTHQVAFVVLQHAIVFLPDYLEPMAGASLHGASAARVNWHGINVPHCLILKSRTNCVVLLSSRLTLASDCLETCVA